jgi:tetratricopeptide (TPR) repeat protein
MAFTSAKPFLSAWRHIDGSSVATAVVQGRECLDELALDALQRFRGAFTDEGDVRPSSLIAAYGNGARLCFHNGRADRAKALLLVALGICEKAWIRTGDIEWCGAMLGPYTFLGKLSVLEGNASAALESYDNVYEFLSAARSFDVGDVHFDKTMLLGLIESNQEFTRVRARAAAVYLVESAKALLIAADYTGLLTFVNRIISSNAISATSVRHALVIAEIRARALSGLGEDEEALREYQRIRSMMPNDNPAFVAIYAHAARVSLRSKGWEAAFAWLAQGELLLESHFGTTDMGASRYHAEFALGLERLSLGDAQGAYSCARRALNSAQCSRHTVGVMRARILMNIAANRLASQFILDADHELANCEAEILRNLYGIERWAALRHLASEQVDGVAARLLHDAHQVARWLEMHQFPIPSELNESKVGGHSSEVVLPSLENPNLDLMYATLRDYSTQVNHESNIGIAV